MLSAADVHVAVRLTELAGAGDDLVALAAAFAVRGPRLGHVLVDLATIRETATVDADEPVDLSALPWPEPAAWVRRLAASPLVALGEDAEPSGARPLRLVGDALYLDRYWREERQVAADLRTFSDGPPATADADVLADGLARLFPGDRDSRPATCRRHRGRAPLRGRRRADRALARRRPSRGSSRCSPSRRRRPASRRRSSRSPAPTGKAAARLEEAVHDEAKGLDVDETVRAQLLELHASTLHRLLGWRPGSHSRFRHHRANRLPHDVVIVDETSMVSLSLMARLVEAVRPGARLVLVGDPGQLTSIEAGAVLGDIVGPATGEGIVVLDRVHRFGGGIALLADAIRAGDPDAVMAVLAKQPDDVTWIPVDVEQDEAQPALDALREHAVVSGSAVVEAARRGRAREAIQALGAFRVLCAHRRGAQGVAAWTARIEGWLASAIAGFDPDGPAYVGRPLLVTENDYGLRLYNGDTGVVVQSGPDRVSAAFERGESCSSSRRRASARSRPRSG